MLRLAIVVCAFSAATVSAFVPKFKWAQDSSHVFLEFPDLECSENGDFTVTRDSIEFKCTTKQGTTAELAFDVREDADPADPRNGCKTKYKSHACTFAKAERHFFDQLPAPYDADRLEPFLSINWRRWVEDDELSVPGMYDNVYNEYTDEIIRPLTDAELATALHEHGRVVVDAHFPWCSTCGKHQHEYVNVVKRIVRGEAGDRGKLPLFARVDLRESRSLVHKYNISCTDGLSTHFSTDGEEPVKNCGLLVMHQHEDDVYIEQRDTEDELLEALAGYIGDTVKRIESADDLARLQGVAPVTVLAVLEDVDTASETFRTLHEACSGMRSLYPCGVTTDASLVGDALDGPGLVLYKPKEDGSSASKTLAAFEGGDGWTEDAISKWCQSNSRAIIAEYSWGLRDKIDSAKLPILQVFVNDEDEDHPLTPAALAKQLEPLYPVAEKYQDKMVALYFRKSNAGYIKDDIFGYEHDSHPAIAISTSFGAGGRKYKFKGDVTSTAAVTKFCKKFFKGKLAPVFKTQPDDDLLPPSPGVLNPFSYNRLASALQDDDGTTTHLLLALYKPWDDSYKSSVQTMLRRVAGATESATGFMMAEMDSTQNHVELPMFPKFVPHDQKVGVYLLKAGGGLEQVAVKVPQKRLTQGKLLTFLKKHVAPVKAAWKQIKTGVKDAKEQVRKENAEIEHRMATAESLPLTDDAGVTKKVLRDAVADAGPVDGQEVEAHYTGRLEDGTVFDSSRTRGTPFKFKLGAKQVIPCWDIGFATMKIGERALLTCQSDYAYGDTGSPPRIPGGATLEFDVEMLGYSDSVGSHSEL